jgi:drug/metabolite transporter (DMT)-like permease
MNPSSQSCPSCGRESPQGSSFCNFCGAAFPKSEPPANLESQQQPQSQQPQQSAEPGPPIQTGASVPSVGAPTVGVASIGGQVITLIGCVLLVIGPFLAWLTAGFISASGMQKTGNEALVLVFLGIIGIAVAAISLAQRRDRVKWVAFVVGVVGLIFSIYYYFALRDQLSEINDGLFSASLGVGIYVCIIASVAVLVGAIAVAVHRKE